MVAHNWLTASPLNFPITPSGTKSQFYFLHPILISDFTAPLTHAHHQYFHNPRRYCHCGRLSLNETPIVRVLLELFVVTRTPSLEVRPACLPSAHITRRISTGHYSLQEIFRSVRIALDPQPGIRDVPPPSRNYAQR